MYPDDGGLKKQVKPLEEAFSGVKVVVDHFMSPKESEVTEEMPRDEAIEYVLLEYYGNTPEQAQAVARMKCVTSGVSDHARLIQQYEPNRLKPAVDVAAEEWAEKYGHDAFKMVVGRESFKAGAAWQKENGCGGDTGNQVEALRSAIEKALTCTPSIKLEHVGLSGLPSRSVIKYDCGDPWAILREALSGLNNNTIECR